jgi:hypothetical protein
VREMVSKMRHPTESQPRASPFVILGLADGNVQGEF